MGKTKIEKNIDISAVKETADVKSADIKKSTSKNSKVTAEKDLSPVKQSAVKSSVKKTPSSKKTTEKFNSSVFIQYDQKEINIDTLLNEVKAAYNATNKPAVIKNIELYIKPEEKAAYYVINGDFFGSISL